jgi:hypothetical protein
LSTPVKAIASLGFPDDFTVCGGRRSRTYVNMVQVALADRFTVTRSYVSVVREVELQIAKINDREEIRCLAVHLEV